MPTECTPELFEFEPIEGRKVVAAFDGGAITSDAGALLLGATDRAINMMQRFAACFDDVRRPELIEHKVVTLVGQRVFGIALGSELDFGRFMRRGRARSPCDARCGKEFLWHCGAAGTQKKFGVPIFRGGLPQSRR